MEGKRKERVLGILVGLAALVFVVPSVQAGSLEPSAPPGATMKTLDEVPPAWSQKLQADDGDSVTGCGSSRFDCVLGGAAVLDKETGLVWEQSPGGNMNWATAQSYCTNRHVGGRLGWRVPTVEELASLVDRSQSPPKLPSGAPFTNVQPSSYWSSTSVAHDPAIRAFFVSFGSGFVGNLSPKTEITPRVWCVRGGHGHDAY